MKKLYQKFSSAVLVAMLMSIVSPLGGLFSTPVARAAADTCTWTGSVNGNWNNGGNWSGCDNGGVPETGDDLVFPTGPSTVSLTNNMSIIPRDITFDLGTSYTISGNSIELSRNLNTFGSTTFNTAVWFSASSGFGQLNVQTGTPTFNAPISLNLTGTANFLAFTSNSTLALPQIIGTTNSAYFTGNPTAPIERYDSSTTPSTFTASSGVFINRAGFSCQSDNCLGVDANVITVEGADASTQAYLRLNSAGLVLDNPITFDEIGVFVGPSLLDVVEDATTTGTITVSDSATISVAATKSLLLNGSVSIPSVSNTLTYTVAAGGQVTHNGSVSGSGNIIVDGYVQMINANTYSGTTTVNSGAILIASNAGSLGTSAGATTVNSGGTLQFNLLAAGSTAEDITVSGTGRPGAEGALETYNLTNSITLSGTITLAGDTTIGHRLAGTANMLFSGVVTGTGELTFTGVTGSGYFDMSNASDNTYTGKTIIDGVVVALNGAGVSVPGDLDINATATASAAANVNDVNQIADNSTVTINSDVAAAGLIINTPTETIGSVAGDGVINLLIAGNELKVGSGNMSSTFNGMIDGDGTITKIGTGTLTLDGVTYQTPGTSPAVAIDEGNVLFNSTLTDTPVIAMDGGTLNGNGSTGSTSVDNGGTYNAGASPGCMTLATLTIDPTGGAFTEEINGNTPCTGYDQTTVTGATDLGGATLSVVPGFTPAVGTVFTILQSNTITGTFSGLADGATFTASGVQFRINYNTSAQSGHTVTLTVLGGTLAQTGTTNYWPIAILSLILVGAALTISRRRLAFQKIRIQH